MRAPSEGCKEVEATHRGGRSGSDGGVGMRRCTGVALFAAALWLCAPPSFAAEAAAEQPRPLRVATGAVAPFVFTREDQVTSGNFVEVLCGQPEQKYGRRWGSVGSTAAMHSTARFPCSALERDGLPVCVSLENFANGK